MPGFDRSGPEGQGSRTGRQMGKCSSSENNLCGQNYNTERGPGRGMGRGAGRAAGRAARWGKGRGFGPGFSGNQGRS